jgi:glycosyltransferase involved in cell wall biosynthesis
VSHATADDLLRLGVVPEGKLVVIPPGIELEPFLALGEPPRRLQARLGAPPSARLVGVVGRLAEVKRPEWALEVFRLLAERHPALQLVFVGDGDQRGRLERAIRALPDAWRERVHLLGAVEDLAPVLADLEALLSTSRAEGLPVALIEAAAAGLPAVATRVGGVPELVADERTGYLGESVDELAYGLARLLEDPAGARAMGRRARIRAQARHSAAGLADRLERLYAAVPEERRCGS